MSSYILLNKNAIIDVFKSFYLCTGIRIVLFDTNYNKVASYPEDDNPFCAFLQSQEIMKERCKKSNIESFKQAKSNNVISIYSCHAGLIEATSPIIDSSGTVHGYIMIGQISNANNKDAIKANLRKYLKNNNIDPPDDDSELFHVKRVKEEQIVAAGKILEMCTNYLLLNDYINFEKESFIDAFNQYIDQHIKDDLSIERLMEAFNMPRNALYNACQNYLNIGIAEYIKNKRIEKAKHLLKNTSLSTKEIASEVGFNDYNYFCRVFKKKAGMSSKTYKMKKGI